MNPEDPTRTRRTKETPHVDPERDEQASRKLRAFLTSIRVDPARLDTLHQGIMSILRSVRINDKTILREHIYLSFTMYERTSTSEPAPTSFDERDPIESIADITRDVTFVALINDTSRKGIRPKKIHIYIDQFKNQEGGYEYKIRDNYVARWPMKGPRGNRRRLDRSWQRRKGPTK